MIAVIFEVEPSESGRAESFRLAEELRPLLADIDGFISIERFESLTQPGRILSLSFWRDEAAVAAWRNVEAHRAAQAAGRAGVFRDYRLRIGHIVRDYGLHARDTAPPDSAQFHASARFSAAPKGV